MESGPKIQVMAAITAMSAIWNVVKDFFFVVVTADIDVYKRQVLAFGKDLLKYRHFEDKQGQDGFCLLYTSRCV